VAEYLKDLDATKAALRAGYSRKAASQAGYKLLQRPDIKAAVVAGAEAHLERADLTAERTLEEYRRLGFSNIKALFDNRGNLRPIHQLPDDVAATIASVEVVKKNLFPDDDQVDLVHKVKLWPKDRILEMLGKHFKLVTDRVEITGDEELIARLQRARARSKKAK
jgi:phage terminase small subunit